MLDNKQILVIDDNKMNQLIYKINLEKAGATVHFISRSRQALTQLDTKKWDAVVLDLELTDSDGGFSIYKLLRSSSTWGNVPIIGVSSSNISLIMPKVQQHGFNGFIAKPISPSLFARQIQAVLSGKTVWNTSDFHVYQPSSSTA